MRRYNPPYHSPPKRGYGSRGRSPPRRGYSGRNEQNNISLLVRNIPLNCRPEDLRLAFERYGPIRDVYLPKDYYTGEPRGIAFVEFVDPLDASEAQYNMDRQQFCGREITVVSAADTRKRPEEMRHRDQPRGPSGYDTRRSYGRYRSRSISRSCSPRSRRYRSRSTSRSRSPHSRHRREHSRSYSPAPRRRGDYSVSPPRRRQSGHPGSLRDYPQGRGDDYSLKSHSPSHGDNGFDKGSHDKYEKGSRSRRRSPRQRSSGSPPGSRSRSAELSQQIMKGKETLCDLMRLEAGDC